MESTQQFLSYHGNIDCNFYYVKEIYQAKQLGKWHFLDKPEKVCTNFKETYEEKKY